MPVPIANIRYCTSGYGFVSFLFGSPNPVSPMPESASSGERTAEGLTLSAANLEQLIGRFLSDYLSEKSTETAGTYGRALNEFKRFHAPISGSFRFRHTDFEAYKSHLTDVRNLHQVSVSTYLTAVRRFCQFLVDEGRLADNPAADVKGNRRPDDHSRKVLKKAEVERLLNAIGTETMLQLRDVAVVASMAFAGLSEIEIVRSDYADVEQTLMGWYLRVQGKGRTAKDEHVPLDPPVVDRLRTYLQARGRVLSQDPLFASHGNRSEGARLKTRSIRSRINLHLERAGLKRPGITPHSLTHTAPLIWLGRGMEIEDVRSRMRHGSLDTTMIYYRKQGLVT